MKVIELYSGEAPRTSLPIKSRLPQHILEMIEASFKDQILGHVREQRLAAVQQALSEHARGLANILFSEGIESDDQRAATGGKYLQVALARQGGINARELKEIAESTPMPQLMVEVYGEEGPCQSSLSQYDALLERSIDQPVVIFTGDEYSSVLLRQGTHLTRLYFQIPETIA